MITGCHFWPRTFFTPPPLLFGLPVYWHLGYLSDPPIIKTPPLIFGIGEYLSEWLNILSLLRNPNQIFKYLLRVNNKKVNWLSKIINVDFDHIFTNWVEASRHIVSETLNLFLGNFPFLCHLKTFENLWFIFPDVLERVTIARNGWSLIKNKKESYCKWVYLVAIYRVNKPARTTEDQKTRFQYQFGCSMGTGHEPG